MSTETEQLLQQMSEMLKNNNRHDDTRQRIKVKSISIPVKVYDGGKSLRVYLNIEAEIRDERDILRILSDLYEMRLDPDYYIQREQGNRYNNSDYRRSDYGNRRR